MIYQYGQSLKATIAGGSTIDPNTGGIITTPDVSIEVECRYLPNTAAKVIKTADGQTVVYRGTCYVRKGEALELSNGDTLTIPGFVDIETPILQLHRAQFRTRIIL